MDLRKEILDKKYPSKILPPLPNKPGSRNRQKKCDFKIVTWDTYFEERRQIPVGKNEFCAYTIGNAGPLLVLLHGGGYSGLTWALFAKEIRDMVECRIVALDLRGHGSTRTEDEDDLNIDTLVTDVSQALISLYPADRPPIIFVGHSMGGAVAVHVTGKGLVKEVVGLIVIDVVEGTAMEALASMQSFLRSRPKCFKTVKDAISWSVHNGQVKNVESAQVSVPGQIVNSESGVLAAYEDAIKGESVDLSDEPDCRAAAIPETLQEDCEWKMTSPCDEAGAVYKWRIDLGKTEKHWSGWFKGLSATFLDCDVRKLLLLANIDRLDKDLMVGQMQGKFAMHVINKAGHAVHEDEPFQVAELVANFLVRNKFSNPKDNFKVILPAC